MNDEHRGHLVLDITGRDLVSISDGPNDRAWLWAAADGALVAKAGTLTDIGSGQYEFTGTTLDTLGHTGRVGTEADLLAGIGAEVGWHLPVQLEMPDGDPLAR